jgi:hypothetical protein
MGWVVNATPRPHYPRERGPVPILQEAGWVQRISPQTGFDPRTVQPVASRYTDWVITAQINVMSDHNNSSNVLYCVYDYEQQQNFDDGLNVLTIWQESSVQRYERTPFLGRADMSPLIQIIIVLAWNFFVMRKAY